MYIFIDITPPKRLKKQTSGITELRVHFASTFPAFFKDLERFVIREKLEEYRTHITNSYAENPLLFDPRLIQQSAKETRTAQAKAKHQRKEEKREERKNI